MLPAAMPKWSRQEQQALAIFLVIFFVGIAGKAWLSGRTPEPVVSQSASVR